MSKRKRTEFIEGIFSNLFLINKTEKKKILNIVEKKEINYFLFYTDYRNIPNILEYGIRQLKNMTLDSNSTYYVWSYLQHEESVDLEFDNSTRAYFWKWASESKMNPENMCVIGIDPIKLTKQTVNDWVFDGSLNQVSVRETIPADSIDWILVRKQNAIKKIEKIIKNYKLNIKVYFGDKSEIKRNESK